MVSTEEAVAATGVFSFPKLNGPENYIQWSRQMVHEIKSAELYGLIDMVHPWPSPETYTEQQFKAMDKKDQKDFLEEIRTYRNKDGSLVGKISKMCEQHIQQLIEVDWSAKATWDFLQKQYAPKGWFNK